MSIFGSIFKTEENNLTAFIDSIMAAKKKQLLVKQHAIAHAVDLIAKTISKSEIKVYKNNNGKIESVKNEQYYCLNIKPNDNEQGTLFFYKVLSKYLLDEEALIVNFNNKLYLADNFISSKSLLLPKTYSNVQISDSSGNSMVLRKIFTSDEVIYLDLKCSKIKEELDSYYKELGSLLGIASSHYKLTNNHKFRLRMPGTQPKLIDPVTKKETSYEEYKKKLTKGLFDEEDAIVLLSDAFGLEKIEFGQSTTSDEWSKLEKKWTDKVAMSFNIPLDIYYGAKTDKSTSTDDFLTFGVIPHLQILEDGLNAKIVKKEDFLKGEHISINRLNMKHKDILDCSTGMDKLFSNGFSHNQICEIVQFEKTDEEWANKHYITKNYMNSDLIDKADMKGGDE